MTVSTDLAYGQEILRKTYGVIEGTIAERVARATKVRGVPMKCTDVSLVPVADEGREVYEVYVTIEPATPDRATSKGDQNEPRT